jgi:hypothetical protein
MTMVYGFEQVTNNVSKHSQMAKVRKSQRIKKSTLSQTLILNVKGPKMPF